MGEAEIHHTFTVQRHVFLTMEFDQAAYRFSDHNSFYAYSSHPTRAYTGLIHMRVASKILDYARPPPLISSTAKIKFKWQKMKLRWQLCSQVH